MSTQIVSGTRRRPERTDSDPPIVGWLWLTLPLAVLVAIVSGTGLLVPNFYRDPPAWAIQTVAQDFTDLVMVVPTLLSSALLAGRGSQRARLVWLGALSYLVYAFVIYAFGVHYNPLFLVYVAALGCSLWALIGGMVTTDWSAITARFATRTPAKVVSLFLIVLAALFYLLWLGDEVPALLSGGVPASIKDIGVPTNPVHVLDMAMLLPAMVLAGVWLWRQQAIGYGLAALLLVNGLFQTLGIAIVMLFSLRAGLPAAAGPVLIFVALAVVHLALLAWYLRGSDSGRVNPTPVYP